MPKSVLEITKMEIAKKVGKLFWIIKGKEKTKRNIIKTLVLAIFFSLKIFENFKSSTLDANDNKIKKLINIIDKRVS